MNNQNPTSNVNVNAPGSAAAAAPGGNGAHGPSAESSTQHAAAPLASVWLPQQMREIVRCLNALTDNYRRKVAAVTQRRDDAHAQAKQVLEKDEKRLDKVKSEVEARFKGHEAEANNLQAEVDKEHGRVLYHFEKQGETPPPLLSPSPGSAADGEKALADARNQLRSAKTIIEQIQAMKKPEKPGSIIKGFAIAGGIIGIIAGVNAYRGNGFSTFVSFIFLGLILGGGTIVGLRYFVSTKLATLFESWSYEKQHIETLLNSYRHYLAAARQHELEAAGVSLKQAQKRHGQALAAADTMYDAEMKEYRKNLRPQVDAARSRCASFQQETAFAGMNWNEPQWKDWQPADFPSFSACLGTLVTSKVELLQPFFSGMSLEFNVPAMLPFVDERGGHCLLLKATGKAKEEANKAIEAVLLRLLANIPPGKVLFTLLDPVGLGQNVASFMPLAEDAEKLITSRAWTEPQHIEEQLSKLTEHMEEIIQKRLQNKYETIEKYNEEARETAEPYRILVVHDFPVNFSENTARRLVSIARNGPRCGVYTLVVMDTDPSKKLPYGFNLADLEQSANVVYHDGRRFAWADKEFEQHTVALDQPPAPPLFNHIIKQVGSRAKDAMKVEVPFNRLLEIAGLSNGSLWQGTTQAEIKVPLGPQSAKKLQYLTFGKGMEHHAVVIGMPGSGKSNLMHIIITTMAMLYSPEEVQLYLVDFKEGVGFKRYAEVLLPHAKVIAIDSEREFGLSVLEGLDKEMRDRGEMFRRLGVEDISEYRQKYPQEKLPRILLLVDEFQEFFSHEDNLSRQANLLLDRLIRQSRYAGIHIMLGSQSLANRSALPSGTLGQVGIRIALKCGEADARQIMADDNPQARLLSRPGEAIYNAASGLIEGNNFFQVALFSDDDRQARLEQVKRFAAKEEATRERHFDRPIIFEGSEPSRLEDCKPLKELLAGGEWPAPRKAVEAWLGEPIAIRDPTSARLRRQGGSHLLVVSREEEEGVGLLCSAVLSLAAQEHPDRAKFFIADLATADSAWADLSGKLAELLPHEIKVLGRRELPGLLKDLVAQVNRRIAGEEGGPNVYLVIQGLHRARDLREEEVRSVSIFDRDESQSEASAPELFATLLREGPETGVHVLAWCDSYSNVRRTIDRRVNEFGLRVVGAMSNDDSMSLIDDPAAAKLDKQHRVIFSDEDKPGYLEKFRPYAIPGEEWLEAVGRTLCARLNTLHTGATGD